jgi:tartrate dehydratase beta subunit/fumarate hydratase class I family protein
MSKTNLDELAAQAEALPIEVVQHVLWHAGDVVLGKDGGLFVSALLTTIGRADDENRLKLSLVFPEYVSGYVASHHDETHDRLRDRVKAEFPLEGAAAAARDLALAFTRAVAR